MVQIIKLAAIEALDAKKPVNIVYGTVKSASPLSIQISQKITLKGEALVLTRNVTDYTGDVTVSHATEKDGSPPHIHGISGKKTVTFHNALKSGEKVVMMRVQGGQKYLVLDRVGGQ
ncbi:DUF2577 domain-containing protein [Bacilliculturomica massiliensis]|uniref:DUF2577 domain-containing protein n=1 Tax=Bacilliculturomica massiliensis TaxID=1917867 RepID=UPI001FE65072|nr:DUF2577 domain-containing protein [Bacilliculturomica massiliensis]